LKVLVSDEMSIPLAEAALVMVGTV
jgi:hypothetical protein